jgi:hypothetical protein
VFEKKKVYTENNIQNMECFDQKMYGYNMLLWFVPNFMVH